MFTVKNATLKSPVHLKNAKAYKASQGNQYKITNMLVLGFVFMCICYIEALNFSDIDDFLTLDPRSTKSLLTLFNLTRCVGTANSQLTRDMITDYYKNLPMQWKVEAHTFTKVGYEFSNLIVTLPHYNKKEASIFDFPECDAIDLAHDLVLAAHYDTLQKVPGFVGASDSAASLSILLYLSLYISHNVTPSRKRNLKIMFFDGEEAFESWNSTDSLYGSKELASDYNKKGLLNNIDLFVLLDLIGATENDSTKNYTIYNYFADTEIYYKQFLAIEKEVELQTGLSFFDSKLQDLNIVIDDDHVSFQAFGVKCLHLIPLPFPSFWHTIADDFKHLNVSFIKHISIILIKFTTGFIEL